MDNQPVTIARSITNVGFAVVIAFSAFASIIDVAGAVEAGSRKLTPIERANATEKGALKNPLSQDPKTIEEGKSLYTEFTCGACHGQAGGGIHCPSLINDAWVYGGDDDTVFRLIAYGSDDLAQHGYSRGDKEMIAGPMPSFSDAIQDEEKLWKIITYVRSLAPTDTK